MCYTSNMTTIKDLLNDFAEELLKKIDEIKTSQDSFEDEEMAWQNAKEILIEEYITTIKNRFIG